MSFVVVCAALRYCQCWDTHARQIAEKPMRVKSDWMVHQVVSLCGVHKEKAQGSARSSPVLDRFHTANFLLCTLLVSFCSAATGSSSVGLQAGVRIRKKGLRSELVVNVPMDDLAVDVVEMTGLLIMLLLLEDHWLLWLRLRLVVMVVLLSLAPCSA